MKNKSGREMSDLETGNLAAGRLSGSLQDSLRFRPGASRLRWRAPSLQPIAYPRDDTHSSMSETTVDSRAATQPIAPFLRSWRWLAAAGAVFVADLFLHLPITDACDALVRRFGFDTWDLVVRRGFLGLGVALVAAVALWSSSQKRLLLTSAALLVALALGVSTRSAGERDREHSLPAVRADRLAADARRRRGRRGRT